jgi:hypothetical protein
MRKSGQSDAKKIGENNVTPHKLKYLKST